MSSIENRFSDFMFGLPSVEVIDGIEHSQDKSSKKADYLGMGRKVIFEQKCVTQDQTQKVQAYMDQFESEEWYPLFVYSSPILPLIPE